MSDKPLHFATPRLQLRELSRVLSVAESAALVASVKDMMTPVVVKYLPPYFHHIHTLAQAEDWLTRMLKESRLCAISDQSQHVVGFLFLYLESTDVHIGYVFGEPHWGQGYASELIAGLVDAAKQRPEWERLVAGVDKSNLASSRLLTKVGFAIEPAQCGQLIRYQLRLT